MKVDVDELCNVVEKSSIMIQPAFALRDTEPLNHPSVKTKVCLSTYHKGHYYLSAQRKTKVIAQLLAVQQRCSHRNMSPLFILCTL